MQLKLYPSRGKVFMLREEGCPERDISSHRLAVSGQARISRLARSRFSGENRGELLTTSVLSATTTPFPTAISQGTRAISRASPLCGHRYVAFAARTRFIQGTQPLDLSPIGPVEANRERLQVLHVGVRMASGGILIESFFSMLLSRFILSSVQF
jgi:hypothetical protein